MRKIILILISIFTLFSVGAQSQNPEYDSSLAKKLGADEYGMKSYIFVVLKTGNNKTSDKAFIDSCFAGHFANMSEMEKAHKLVVAGPFGKNDNEFRGLFILDVKTIAEAKELLKNDPSIDSDILRAEYYTWYGSAALPVYLEAADKIWKKSP